MRVAFMGSPEFAVPSLERLSAAHEVVAVYTRPDRPRGRGREPVPTPVKAAALNLDIPVFEPHSFREVSVVEQFRSLELDIACVAAYGLILPEEVLAAPRHGCVNVHASLLPRHRGAAPIHRAILEGDISTGVCIMQMEAGLDTGPYARCVTTSVDEKSVPDLESELAVLGADALIDVLGLIERDEVEWVRQDDSLATYASKVSQDDVVLDPALSTQDALRRVRASSDSARAKIRLCECVLDVLEARPSGLDLRPGQVVAEKTSLHLGFLDGSVEALVVRPEGKKRMEACAWARGARVASSDCWEAW